MILIKGMEMPKSCADCPFAEYFKRLWWCKVMNDLIEGDMLKRSNDCPLLQIVTEYPIVFRNGEIVKDGNEKTDN